MIQQIIHDSHWSGHLIIDINASDGIVNGIVNGIVSGNEQAIINFLKVKLGLNVSEIAKGISKSWRIVMRYLKFLLKKAW